MEVSVTVATRVKYLAAQEAFALWLDNAGLPFSTLPEESQDMILAEYVLAGMLYHAKHI